MMCLEFLEEDEVTLSKRAVKEGLNFDCAFPTVIWRQMKAAGLPPYIGFCSSSLGPTEQSSVSQWRPTISFRLRKGQVLCCLSKHSPQWWEAGTQELNALSRKMLQLPQILEYLVFVSLFPTILEVQIHPSGRIHLPTLLYSSPVSEERDALEENCLLTMFSVSIVNTTPSSMTDTIVLLFILYSYFI